MKDRFNCAKNKFDYIEVLDSCTSYEEEGESLTSLHDRGGLTYVKNEFSTLIIDIEVIFRDYFNAMRLIVTEISLLIYALITKTLHIHSCHYHKIVKYLKIQN